MPLIKAARADGYGGVVILSTTTETGKSMAIDLGGDLFDLHIYYPWDKKQFVRSALDSLNPRAFVTLETELWPNMLWELEKRKIPSFLANGRISDRTRDKLRGRFGGKVGRAVFNLFTALCLRGEEDKKRLMEVGIAEEKILVTGDSKIDALLARRDEGKAAGLGELLEASRSPVFIAGSTHTGEDEVVLEAYLTLKKQKSDARLIIAPRHPERAPAVKELFPEEIKTCLLSEQEKGWDVIVVDKIGSLFDLYSLGAAAFVGGSLVRKGGQNLLEPAAWGLPVQHGPYMDDFAEASREFIKSGLARVVRNPEELASAWLEIINEDSGGKKQGRLAAAYFDKSRGASRRAWQGIKQYLEI